MNELDIFTAALELTESAAREGFLDEACAAHPELRSRIEALLRNASQASRYLEPPPSDRSTQATLIQPQITEAVGSQVGPYKLREQIGEGGMGIVYVAEQERPVRRKVAFKVIKPGMDTKVVIARFEAERQALAMMDHSNIARVLDAGTTEAGRPYFVMELVKGIPIIDYCDQARLPTVARLQLFVDVCRAVQHAHQKGIIHRDLKPSNVLVTEQDGRAIVKVIDFGIAKALGQQLTEKTIFTGHAQMVGTPLYMSPEQAALSAVDVDTRSDVYSLGVMLYELLTGTTPFDKETFSKVGFDELRRMIREQEHPRPSTRLSTLQAKALSTICDRRQVDPRRLNHEVRGELDWIVMKALEKDRARRYETASAFAADIERYLADEPVEACPPSAGYRFGKFARRNKAKFMIAALVAAVVAAASGFGWQHVRQQAETDRQSELALQEVTIFQGESNWAQATAALKRAEVLLAGQGGSAKLQRRTDGIRRDLDMASELEEIRVRATRGRGGDIYWGTGLDFDMADADYRKAFRAYGVDLEALDAAKAAEFIRAQAIHQDLVGALDHWARLLNGNETKKESRNRLLRIARLADSDDWRNQVRLAITEGNVDALKALARAEQVQALPPSTLDLLADALRSLGANPEAVALLRAAQRRHPGDFWINTDLARMIRINDSSAHDEAVRFCTAALAARPTNPDAHYTLGFALFCKGSLDEAAAAFREASRLNPNHLWARLNLSHVLITIGLNDEAISVCQETLRHFKDGHEAGELCKVYDQLGVALGNKGQLDEAIASYREAIWLKPDNAGTHNNLAIALYDKGQLDEALSAFREAIRFDKDNAIMHTNFGSALAAKGQLDEAIASHREAIRLKPDNAGAHNNLALLLATCSDPKFRDIPQAVQLAQQAVKLKPSKGSFWSTLGVCLYRAGDWSAAVAAFQKSMELEQGASADWFFVAMAHWQLDHKAEARKWYDQAVQWMDTNKPEDAELRRFRTEADELMKDE